MTSNLGSIVADLLRLIVLVPKEDYGRAGRYFLHVYRGDPLTEKLIKVHRDDKTKRDWVEQLLAAGDHQILDLELDKEKKWPSFFLHLGPLLETAKCSMSITNYRIVPPHKKSNPSYTIVLTRINSAEVTFGGTTMTVSADRSVTFNPASKSTDFRKEIASAMKPKKPRKPRTKKVVTKAAAITTKPTP
jgi:hypothetical protein